MSDQNRIANYLKFRKDSLSNIQSIPNLNIQEGIPLSFSQERLWFLSHFDTNNPVYNRPVILRIHGEINNRILTQSINRIIQKHQILRTTYISEKGILSGKVLPSFQFNLQTINLSSHSNIERLSIAKSNIHISIQKPFHISTGPFFRGEIYKLDDDDFILLFVFHHLIFDAWSETILINELSQIYEALKSKQPEPVKMTPVQYSDFAQWQRDQVQNHETQKQLAYWENKLKDSDYLKLPVDFQRSSIDNFEGSSYSFRIHEKLCTILKVLGKEEDATMYMILLSSFLVFLHHYTQDNDIILGTPLSGRQQEETRNLIGIFIKTLAIRTNFADNPTFRELVSRVRKTCLEAFSASDIPFEKIVEVVKPDRNFVFTPIFQIFFNFENIPQPVDKIDGFRIERIAPDTNFVQYDIIVELISENNSISGNFEFNKSLFKIETIQRMVKHFLSILHEVAENPDERIRNYSFLDHNEYHTIVHDWNRSGSENENKKCLHDLFELQVKRNPDSTAIVFEDQILTYSELNSRANQIAHYLLSMGVNRDANIGIHIPKSFEMIFCTIGVMKTGATYVPLDHNIPENRVLNIARDANVTLILDTLECRGKFDSLSCKTLSLKEFQKYKNSYSIKNPQINSDPNDPIYLIYTSGTTGSAKGVYVRHRSVVNYLEYFRRLCELQPDDVVLQIPPLSFDASVEDIFSTLLSGGTLILLDEDSLLDPDQIKRAIEDHQITCILSTVPSFWRAIIGFIKNHPFEKSSIRLITLSGETLFYKDCYSLWGIFGPETTLINAFGPTECTLVTTFHQVRNRHNKVGPVPVGRPLQNTQVYILNESLSPVPVGVTGDLYIGGEGLAYGYWNRPVETAKNFMPNPFSLTPGDRIYNTADRCRYRSDGIIEFKGRADDQVKIRGNRVEIGEVEAVIKSCIITSDCAVVLDSDHYGENFLVAFVIFNSQKTPTNIDELQKHLIQYLPSYMIPSFIIESETLPLTTNGKIDRKALPRLDKSNWQPKSTHMPPVTKEEEDLHKIWCRILGLETISVDDNFFELGGHSLLGLRLISKVEDTFGTKIPLSIIYQSPTIASMAEFLNNLDFPSKFKSLVALQPKGKKPPLFCVPPAASTALRFKPLADILGNTQPVYSFDYPGIDGKCQPLSSIPEISRIFLSELKMIQPNSPYYLVGMCYGGSIAFEIAQQLTIAGDKVAFLGIIDSNIAPRNRRPFPYYIYAFRKFVFNNLLRMNKKEWDLLPGLYRRDLDSPDPVERQIAEVNTASFFGRMIYLTQPYPGKIIKFSTDSMIAKLATRQWAKITSVGLEEHKIPGYHDPTPPDELGILADPNIHVLARKLTECMNIIYEEYLPTLKTSDDF